MRSILVTLLSGLLLCHNCSAQSLTDSLKAAELAPQVAPEKLRFKILDVKKFPDGSRVDIDTTSGYEKFYNKNGKLVMEGRVVPSQPKGYRDGIWNYYTAQGLLMKQETYRNQSKLRQLDFLYIESEQPEKETIQYFEGDYKDTATFKFIKIVISFYPNGQKESESHQVNRKLVYLIHWDSAGKPKRTEDLKLTPPPRVVQ